MAKLLIACIATLALLATLSEAMRRERRGSAWRQSSKAYGRDKSGAPSLNRYASNGSNGDRYSSGNRYNSVGAYETTTPKTIYYRIPGPPLGLFRPPAFPNVKIIVPAFDDFDFNCELYCDIMHIYI